MALFNSAPRSTLNVGVDDRSSLAIGVGLTQLDEDPSVIHEEVHELLSEDIFPCVPAGMVKLNITRLKGTVPQEWDKGQHVYWMVVSPLKPGKDTKEQMLQHVQAIVVELKGKAYVCPDTDVDGNPTDGWQIYAPASDSRKLPSSGSQYALLDIQP
jgi:hypothetical protein